MKCWICNTEMKYIKDEELEELEMYRFNCSECEEAVLVPVDNPFLSDEDFI